MEKGEWIGIQTRDSVESIKIWKGGKFQVSLDTLASNINEENIELDQNNQAGWIAILDVRCQWIVSRSWKVRVWKPLIYPADITCPDGRHEDKLKITNAKLFVKKIARSCGPVKISECDS